MSTLDVESVDLAALVAAIRTRFDLPLPDAMLGRTVMRDVVAEHLACSALEAEQLVDTLIARGFVRLDRDASGLEVWRLSSGT